jgi:hypothetical protein
MQIYFKNTMSNLKLATKMRNLTKNLEKQIGRQKLDKNSKLGLTYIPPLSDTPDLIAGWQNPRIIKSEDDDLQNGSDFYFKHLFKIQLLGKLCNYSPVFHSQDFIFSSIMLP